MKPKTRRLWIVLIGGLCLFAAAAIIMTVFRNNLVFFFSPTELQQIQVVENKRIRIGGLVKDGSVKKTDSDLVTEFELTDINNSVPVKFKGILPPLFREGQGIIAEGYLKNSGIFEAENLLTKHDEKYMPPEVADALKKSGQWKGRQ